MNYNQFNQVGACPQVNFDKSRKVYNNHDQLLGVTQRVLVVTMKVFLVLALAVASVSAGIVPLDTPMRPRDLEGVPSINGRITNGKFNICALVVSFRFTIINKQSSVVFATAAVLYQRLPRDLMTRWTDHIAAVNGQFGWPIKDD